MLLFLLAIKRAVNISLLSLIFILERALNLILSFLFTDLLLHHVKRCEEIQLTHTAKIKFRPNLI